MNSNYAYLSFYLASIFFYTSDVLQKTSSKAAITWPYLFIRSCYSSVISVAFTILFFGVSSLPSFSIISQLSFCSIWCGFGLFFYVKSINTLQFSNVGSLTIVGNVLQQLSGILLFKEKFTAIDFVAYAFMSFGCILQLLFSKTFKGAKYVLLSTLFWTSGYIMLSRVLKQTTVYWSVPIIEITIMAMGFIMVKVYPIILKSKVHLEETKTIQPIYLVGIAVLTYFASLMNNNLFKNLPISTIGILQLSLMPITYLVSLKIFKEKPNKLELISFITGFLGFALFVYTH